MSVKPLAAALAPLFLAAAAHAQSDDAPIELEESQIQREDPDAPKEKKKKDKKEQARNRFAGGASILAKARATLAEKGCVEAAPSFRVAAAMGEGMEAAQHELGVCLLGMEADTDVQTQLFRDEGWFWLERAAYAGNARAQRELALRLAAPNTPHADQSAALGWALVYDANPEADVYGSALPSTLIDGLRRDLDAPDVEAAETFAADFAPFALKRFDAPKPPKGAGGSDAQRRPPPGGAGRRRRNP